MSGHKMLVTAVAVLPLMTGRLQAQHGGGMHGASWHGSHSGGWHPGARVNGGQVFVGGGGYFFGVSPILVIAPGGFLPPMGWVGPTVLPAARTADGSSPAGFSWSQWGHCRE